MTSYRRVRVPGGTYFFTVNLLDRRSSLLVDYIEQLRRAVGSVRRELPFEIHAWVVLPDHLHALWSLPEDDSDFSTRWRMIKSRFSRQISGFRAGGGTRSVRGERMIWQRRFWEHVVRDNNDYERHMDYIHFNPVKHGHVRQVGAWPYSTFHRCVSAGLYPPEWAYSGGEFQGGFGERDELAPLRRGREQGGNR
jgi:putative transposase